MSDDDAELSHTPEEFNPYQTLNVAPDATVEEIQESFKKLSRTFHPDRNTNLTNPDTLYVSRQQFEAITRAKEILCNSQTRQAYDHFGIKGIEMMQRNLYEDIKSLQIGKKYRNDNAVQHLLKYYLKQEAKFELDKLLSTQGHCELGIDATSLYQEFVDLIFRHETIPQFINNIKNGIPTLQIVINEDDDDDIDDDMDDDELSMSELMSFSVEDQVSIIQNALNSGDMTILKNIPVERQSITPQLLSFLISIGFQYEYNDNNMLILSFTQYNDEINNNNKIFQNINIELHQQYNRFLKFIYNINIGLQTLNSKFGISRTINNKTNINFNLHFNWLYIFNTNNENNENAADLFGNMFNEKGNNESNTNNENLGYLHIIPEIFLIFKNSILWSFNFLKNISFNNIINIGGGGGAGAYPGFDISFGIQRVLFNQWLGISNIRIGESPSFSCNIFQNNGPKQWDFKIDFSPKTFVSLICKHNKKIENDFSFYCILQFDLINILKFECGFNKLYENKISDKDINIINEIDIKQIFGIDISLKQGISIKFGYRRGPSQINIPIKCTQGYSSLKQILLSFIIPACTYFGYKFYYKKYLNKYKQNKIKSYLNENGKLLYNKRQFALKQQLIIIKQSNKNKQIEINKNGLIILCAYYGNHVEKKLFDAIRKYKQLDNDDDDDDDDNDQQEDKHDEEEKKDYINGTNGELPPPPLLFNIYPNNNKNNKNKKETNYNHKYIIKLCQIDWLNIENELEKLMINNPNEDKDLLSFINVRIVLQYMVNNNKSELILTSGNKSYLPGFYNCCKDNNLTKELIIIYKYKNKYKYVTIPNMFPLTIPNDSHIDWFNCRNAGYS